MNILDHLPLLLLLAGSVTAFLFDRVAVLRRSDNDRGDYWVFVTTSCAWLLPFLLLSAWAQTIYSPWWLSGYHLHFDLLNNAFNSTIDTRYYLALALPFALWLLLLITGTLKKPLDKEKARWLAGAISFSHSRSWILFFAAPLLLLLVFTSTELGGGEGAYSAATWGTLAVFVISLIGVAFSGGKWSYEISIRQTIQIENLEEAALNPWPEAVKARGIKLTEDIAVWEKDTSTGAVKGPTAENLVNRLHLMGAQGLPPELVKAIATLLNPEDKKDIHSLIIAPDDCGQTEIVALAAKILEQRYHTTTLIITVAKAEQMAQRLQRWIAGKVSCNEIPQEAMIWVVDAETLSDRILPAMQNPDIVKRIGFIVWWHLEKYTGVLSANLWAISRRLDRLIQFQGRQEVRTLALVRTSLDSSAQIDAFLNQLLPSHFAANVRVLLRFPNKTRLHILESHQDFFQQSENRNIEVRYPLLTTSKISVEENWSTHLETPDDITASDANAFLQLPINDSTLKDKLCQDTDKAEVRLISLQPSDVLGVVEMLSQTGRASKTSHEYHVGMTLPDNPYIHYLMSTLSARQDTALGFGISKRLVGAKSQESVIRRHLILALNELEDTRSGLLKNFNWEEKLIYKTLDEISKEGQLIQEEVRYLNERDRLIIEPKYKSTQLPPDSEKGQPLNTVNSADKLIDVRDPTKGGEIQMRVDPERLTIQAYPHRIFAHAGRRYKIDAWNWETLEDTGHITCKEESVHSKSWRIRNMEVYDVEALPGEKPINISQTGIPFKKQKVNLNYEEVVSGTFIQETDLTTCKAHAEIKHRLDEPISQEFATQALILGFTEPEALIALNSLCQALRQVLPVHLGVEEDALEIVPVETDMNIFGIAIVDLYPKGIGLVDAFYNDAGFILSLLKWTKEWLENCSCDKDEGCEQCLRTLSAKAAIGDALDQYPTPASALRILTKVV
jgi:hypothetical protein